jgi:phosphoribosylformylglycinamidine synthase PurS subunit
MRFEALIEVRLRPGIADPQGQTIERALPALGFSGIGEVRTGKAIRLVVDAADEAAATAQVEDLCLRFLTNPVIEDALVTVVPAGAPGDLPGRRPLRDLPGRRPE